MPYAIHKSRAKGGGYDIVKKTTGKKVGHSTSRAKAEASVRARHAGAHSG
ncbi:MAG: hypothetical protein WCL53_10065 [Chloroflexota bacterium]